MPATLQGSKEGNTDQEVEPDLSHFAIVRQDSSSSFDFNNFDLLRLMAGDTAGVALTRSGIQEAFPY